MLNPAIIVDPPALTDGLRAALPTLLEVSPRQAFAKDDGDFRSAVERCIGVGRCVSTQGSTLMCPSYRATRDEQHSTRGRARLLQEMVTGSLANEGWGSAEVRDALDLCLACRGCVSQCPTSVDMAAYKSEFLDHHYRRRLRPLSHYSLGWLPLWLKLTSRVPRLVNAITRSRLTRRLFAGLAGIAPSRGIPPIAERAFTRDWRPRSGAAPAPHGRVVLWPDTFNDRLTPEVAHAAVRVVEAAGFEVVVPARTVCCGLTWQTTGQLSMARRVLHRSLGAPELGGDLPVLVLEPSCATMLRSDLPELLPGDPRAARLANRVVTLAELLDGVEYVGPPAVGAGAAPALAQPHCHQQAVLGLDADRRVRERNGIDIEVELEGCCGLAGNFGAEAGHEDLPAGRRAGAGAGPGGPSRCAAPGRWLQLPHPDRIALWPARPPPRRGPGRTPDTPARRHRRMNLERALAPLAVLVAALALAVWLMLINDVVIGPWLLATLVLFHGWVHLMFVFPKPPSPNADSGASAYPFAFDRSWLIGRAGLDSGLVRIIGRVLVAVVFALSLLAALSTVGLVVPGAWWSALMVLAALSSSLVLVLFYSPALVLGFAINAAMIVLVLSGSWSPA